MSDIKLNTATGLIAWYIRAMKCRGWTSFWNNPCEVEARVAEYA